ncbi:MAG: type II toxin-antitoxin system RelE/ParE family toxin [Nitrospirota bacterium]|nr:type II toxin-antitoxin system RelE/ParE family toxin [Nitrospirota bacterium]
MTKPVLKLRIPDDTAQLIRTLHPELRKKIRAGLNAILVNPVAGKALRDELAGLRSFRVGRSRIIYRAGKNVIELVAIGPRERIYEDTYRLLKKEMRP